jgi:hypothetical protein
VLDPDGFACEIGSVTQERRPPLEQDEIGAPTPANADQGPTAACSAQFGAPRGVQLRSIRPLCAFVIHR